MSSGAVGRKGSSHLKRCRNMLEFLARKSGVTVALVSDHNFMRVILFLAKSAARNELSMCIILLMVESFS